MNLSDYVSHENADKKIEIQQTVDQLGHIDRAVLHLWVEGYTQTEIANIFGFSQSKISRILKNLCKK